MSSSILKVLKARSVPLALIAPRYSRQHMFLYVHWAYVLVPQLGLLHLLRRQQVFLHLHLQPISPLARRKKKDNFANHNIRFSNVGLNALYLHVKLFPYTQRSQGLAFKQLIGRGGNFFNTYVDPIGLDGIGWKYYTVYCGWLMVEAIIICFLFPETHNRALEELSFFLEGKEVNERAQNGIDKVMEHESQQRKREES